MPGSGWLYGLSPTQNPSPLDMCETAWGIIANAHGGNWEDASSEWREAAERWRDTYHALLDRTLDHGMGR